MLRDRLLVPGMKRALGIVQGPEFYTSDACCDLRTIDIEDALIKEIRRLGGRVETPNYLE